VEKGLQESSQVYPYDTHITLRPQFTSRIPLLLLSGFYVLTLNKNISSQYTIDKTLCQLRRCISISISISISIIINTSIISIISIRIRISISIIINININININTSIIARVLVVVHSL
jgi:hypothetical protein